MVTTSLTCNTSTLARPLPAVAEVEVEHTHDGAFRLRAEQPVDAGDPYLAAHFPGHTVYAGAFILESVRQAAEVALDAPLRIAAVHSMRFLAPLLANDTLLLDATLTAIDASGRHTTDAVCARADGTAAARVRLDLTEVAGA